MNTWTKPCLRSVLKPITQNGYSYGSTSKPTSTKSTPAQEPTTQKECERWCSSKYGAGTPGIFFNNACACRCKDGYVLTEKGRKLRITIEECDQLCIDKYGVQGIFNSDEICKCVQCDKGYELNKEKTRCIKITPTPTKKPRTPAPTYNYDDDYTYSEPVPGFEAVFVIAGLLIVADLMTIRRRRK